MSNTKHQLVEYGSDYLVYGEKDPVTRNSFVAGEKVVLCVEARSLISLRSLEDIKRECPHCGNRLNQNLTISGAVKPSLVKPIINTVPARPSNSNNAPVFWGAAVVFIAICFIASALGLFGTLTAITGSATPIRTHSSPTIVPSQPEPTSMPRSTSTARPISPPATQSSGVSTSCSMVKVNVDKTSSGTVLHITPCSGSGYNLPPLPDGTYEVASSNKFIVYVSADYDGSVYIAKIGDVNLTRLGRLRQDHNFSVFFRSETPSYRLVLSDSWLTIYEEKFGQNASYAIPTKFTR